MTEPEKDALLKRYSNAQISAVELRRTLGGVTFGDVLIELAQRGLPLPRAPETGRQQRIAEARSLLFPKDAWPRRASLFLSWTPARLSL
jgi:hypothetical protein